MGARLPSIHGEGLSQRRRRASQRQSVGEGDRGRSASCDRSVQERSRQSEDERPTRRGSRSIMAKGRELKGRIKSVENTRKITRTMEMVATSKMKRAADRVIAARPYAKAMAEVIANLYSPDLADRFPLLRQPASTKRAAIVMLTSNRGLAGAFNANLIKETRNLMRKLEGEGAVVDLHVVGRKGLGYFRYVNREVKKNRTDVSDRPTTEDAANLVNDVMAEFANGGLD